MSDFKYGAEYTEEELDRLARDTAGTPHGSVLCLIEQLRYWKTEADVGSVVSYNNGYNDGYNEGYSEGYSDKEFLAEVDD